MPDEPTLGEIARRLEAIAQQQRDMLEEMRTERREFAQVYVRRDVYDLAHQKLRDDLADDIEKHDNRLDKIEAREADLKNRLNGVLATVIGALIVSIIIWLASTVIQSGALG